MKYHTAVRAAGPQPIIMGAVNGVKITIRRLFVRDPSATIPTKDCPAVTHCPGSIIRTGPDAPEGLVGGGIDRGPLAIDKTDACPARPNGPPDVCGTKKDSQ